MAYRKRPATARTCVHCREPYQAVDRRRLYCSDSCKVQACKASRRRRLALPAPALAAPASFPAPAAAPGSPPPVDHTLAWSLQNFGLLASAAAVGNLGVKLGEHLVASVQPPPPPPLAGPAADPVSWLPPGLLSANAPRVWLDVPALGQPLPFVQLLYWGHTLYYQPRHRLLLWRAAPGQLVAVRAAEQLARLAEQAPAEASGSPRLRSVDPDRSY